MTLSRIALMVLLALPVTRPAEAQNREWIPQGIENLRRSAASKTEFCLDHSMLVFASRLSSDNEDFRRVIAGVSGLSVHSYRYPGPGTYDLQALDSVKQEYKTAGWKQLLNKHEKNGDPGVTELWVHLDHNAVSDIAVLVARSNEVNFISVSGSISPLDLAHLGGHFGIPRIEGGVLAPSAQTHP
jgi:hypothetical protein